MHIFFFSNVNIDWMPPSSLTFPNGPVNWKVTAPLWCQTQSSPGRQMAHSSSVYTANPPTQTNIYNLIVTNQWNTRWVWPGHLHTGLIPSLQRTRIKRRRFSISRKCSALQAILSGHGKLLEVRHYIHLRTREATLDQEITCHTHRPT